jgi:hypothetical protein
MCAGEVITKNPVENLAGNGRSRFAGTPGRIRTYGLWVRNPTLYPLSYGRMHFARQIFYHCLLPKRLPESVSVPRLPAINIPTTDLKRLGPAMPAGAPLRGSYLIRFENGEHFLGVTENIVLRIGSHRRTWGDMAVITYWPLAGLDAVPVPETPERVARPGPPLRKIDRDDPGLDPVLDRMRWADENIFERHDLRLPERPDQRERTWPLFDRLASHPDYQHIVELAGRYLQLFVPAPAATEVRNWVVTSMPSTVKTRYWHRLICLSINNVEALTIGTQFDGSGWTTLGFMSANPSDESPADLLVPNLAARGLFLAPAWYETVGPVYQVGFDRLGALAAALEDEVVQDLVGVIAMRLMKRGRGLYGRFHDYNLADLVLEKAVGRRPPPGPPTTD